MISIFESKMRYFAEKITNIIKIILSVKAKNSKIVDNK